MVPSPPARPTEDAALLSVQETRERYRTVRTAIRAGAAVLVCYFAFRALEAIAGQNTAFSLTLSLIFTAFFELKFVAVLSLAGLSIAWAVGERKLRYLKVEYLQSRIKALETGMDPNRSSSNLTIEGKTNPEDRGG